MSTTPSEGMYAASDDGNRRLKCALGLMVGWRKDRFRRFLEVLDGGLRAWLDAADDHPSVDVGFLTKSQRESLEQLRSRGADRLEQRVAQWSGEVVLCGEDAYPDALEVLDHPPAALHVRGAVELLKRPALAVVGSREISVDAASAARRLLEKSIRRGLLVTSGGALGSDAVAHRAAATLGAPTISVLPSGVENATPKSNRKLFSKIVDEGGALVSEYRPRQSVRRYHFRRRNRLIAAMTRGVFVMRAGEDSGTMLTVDAARDLEKPLAAMPGDPADPLAVGCHEIIRRGGALIARPDDLRKWWASLAPEVAVDKGDEPDGSEPAMSEKLDDELLERAAELVGADGAFSLDELERATGKSAAELQTALLERELSGLVERLPGTARYRIM